MSAAFTPGPWEYDGDFETVSSSINGAVIADVCVASDFPCLEDDERPQVDAECLANAHLIAAAPELYEALVSAFNLMGTTTDCLNSGEPSRHRYAEQRLQREMDQVRGVLSKALRGEQ